MNFLLCVFEAFSSADPLPRRLLLVLSTLPLSALPAGFVLVLCGRSLASLPSSLPCALSPFPATFCCLLSPGSSSPCLPFASRARCCCVFLMPLFLPCLCFLGLLALRAAGAALPCLLPPPPLYERFLQKRLVLRLGLRGAISSQLALAMDVARPVDPRQSSR